MDSAGSCHFLASRGAICVAEAMLSELRFEYCRKPTYIHLPPESDESDTKQFKEAAKEKSHYRGPVQTGSPASAPQR